jgi:hypothetical protein
MAPLDRESRAREDFDRDKLIGGEVFDEAEDTVMLSTTSRTYWYLRFGLNQLRAMVATCMVDNDVTTAELRRR